MVLHSLREMLFYYDMFAPYTMRTLRAYARSRTNTLFPNLANNDDADRIIHAELTATGITVCTRNNSEFYHDVPATIMGKLSQEFTFERLPGSWEARGKVPLELARTMYYEDQVGFHHVRVAAHPHMARPEEGVEWYEPGGKMVMAARLAATFAELAEKDPEKFGDTLEVFAFTDDPSSIGAKPYVTRYIITSPEGLNYFVQQLKDHQLV